MPFTNNAYTSTWQARLDTVTDLTIRKRPLLQLMSNRGRITGPTGGNYVEWPLFVQAKKPHGFDRNTPPTYVQADNLRMARLDWANYQYGESLHVIDLEENMGKERFIDIVDNASNSIEKAFTQEWPSYLYQDGALATEPSPMYGLKSAFRYYTAATATSGAPRQGYQGKVRLPNGTYAGYDTTLGAQGGNWGGGSSATTTYTDGSYTFHYWPAGRGEGKFDFWSPMVVNTTSQGWGSTSAAFDTTYCEDQLDFAIQYSQRNNGVPDTKDGVNLVLWTTNHELIWRKRFSSTSRTIVEQIGVPAEGSMAGVPNTGSVTGRPLILHNGCLLATDFDMDENLAIGVNLGSVEYRTVYSKTGTGRVRFMTPYEAEIPGGAGMMMGGRTHGQFIINSPRHLFFMYALGNYTL